MTQPRRSKRLSRARGSPSYESPDPPRVRPRVAKAEREAARIKHGGKPKRHYFTAPENEDGRDMRRKRKRVKETSDDSGCDAETERTPKVARTGEYPTPAPHGAFRFYEYNNEIETPKPNTPEPETPEPKTPEPKTPKGKTPEPKTPEQSTTPERKQPGSASEASSEIRALLSSGQLSPTEVDEDENRTSDDSDYKEESEPETKPVVTPARQIALSWGPTRLRARRSGAPPPFTTPTVRFRIPSPSPGAVKAEVESAKSVKSETSDEDFWTSSTERDMLHLRRNRERFVRGYCPMTDRMVQVDAGPLGLFDLSRDLPEPVSDEPVFPPVELDQVLSFLPATLPPGFLDDEPKHESDNDTDEADEEPNEWEVFVAVRGGPTAEDMARGVPGRPQKLLNLLYDMFSLSEVPKVAAHVSFAIETALTNSTASTRMSFSTTCTPCTGPRGLSRCRCGATTAPSSDTYRHA